MLTEKISSITEEPVANRSDVTEVASIQEPPKKSVFLVSWKMIKGQNLLKPALYVKLRDT